ncbi:MAG: ribonuclease G [Pseudomonadota bacterium]
MSEDILVNVTPQETRVATIEQGSVQELHIERSRHRGIVGNLYMGRVARVLPGMQSAFIDIGLERAAFLHVADIFGHRPGQGSAEPARPIERILQEGQRLLVQVIKDPIGTKGARLSTQVSLAGRLLVYLPQDPHIGISQRIEDAEERNHLRERVERVRPADERGGFIIRTVAEAATERELATDVAYLRALWTSIQEAAQSAQPPALLHEELTLALRVLRDMLREDTPRVVIDSRETWQKAMAFAARFMPAAAGRIEHYAGERPLFEVHGVDAEIERALSRRVDLKSGGYLIIDQTEAMTTVDVNTGGFVGSRSFDDTVFKTNLEAALAIARQMRLRNLGGIIIVDFIDMDSAEHREAVLAELRKAMARDRTRITVNGFTSLGLVEVTRKRTRESLARVLCQPGPPGGGRGEVRTEQTVCFTILRELLREARQFGSRELRVVASQPVVDLFLDEESHSLAMLGDFIGRPISLQVETAYAQEQFDIVLR